MIALERSGNGYEEGVSGLRLGSSSKISLSDGRVHDHIEIRLDDVNLAAVDCRDRMFVDIYADDFFLAGSKNRCGGKPNVTKAHY